MEIAIIPKPELTIEQLQLLRGRVDDPKHAYDKGPCPIWDKLEYVGNIFVVTIMPTITPIGILYRSGPLTHIDVAWWIDSLYRQQRYGSKMIDLFADILKVEGVTGIGQIQIDGPDYEASRRLVIRLKKHFKQWASPEWIEQKKPPVKAA